MTHGKVRVRRIYDDVQESDGTRVLVDRVWPRGMKKESARLDEWIKEVAPSTELRKWYGHDPEKFPEFRRRYRDELSSEEGSQAFDRLLDLHKNRRLTLLTATKDVEHSQAQVLADLLTGNS
jgi:uncharacterized protein YeaO (DUF488 family)